MRIMLISGRRPYHFLNNIKNNLLPAGQSKNNLGDNLYITAKKNHIFFLLCAHLIVTLASPKLLWSRKCQNNNFAISLDFS